eukprot:TRINITY_DN67709_c8_g2_i3.p1 TRINITY_DN67709_c8_g2~~TRINITY_DN67709_c8_g2_i3.p1  ORF type:complete len:258 (+),score=40.51 TRINITY_DN67709_c8_g2_i3:662-1435(+)
MDVHVMQSFLKDKYPGSWFHITWSGQINDRVLHEDPLELSVGWVNTRSTSTHSSGQGLYFIDQPAIAAHGVLKLPSMTGDEEDCLAAVVVPGSPELDCATVDVSSTDLKGQHLTCGKAPQPTIVVGSTLGDEWLPWQRHVKHWLWHANRSWNLHQHTVQGNILMVPSIIPERHLQWYPNNNNKNKEENNRKPRELHYRWSEPTRELVFTTQPAIDQFVEENWKLVLFPKLNWGVGKERLKVLNTHHIAVNLPKLQDS